MSSARAVSATFQSNCAQLREQEGALGGVLELLERRRTARSAAEPGLRLARAGADEPVDVGGVIARPRREDQQPFDRVAQLAHVARPVELRQSRSSAAAPSACARARPSVASSWR